MAMKQIVTRLILASAFLFTPFSFAQSAGDAASKAAAGGKYEAFMSAGYAGISSSASEYDIIPGVGLAPLAKFPWFQITGELTYQKIAYRGSSTTNMMVLAGPTVNLSSNFTDSAFISLGIADRMGTATTTDTSAVDSNGIGFYFIAGKRIPLTGALSFRPSLGVVSTGVTGMVFRPFALSYSL